MEISRKRKSLGIKVQQQMLHKMPQAFSFNVCYVVFGYEHLEDEHLSSLGLHFGVPWTLARLSPTEPQKFAPVTSAPARVAPESLALEKSAPVRLALEKLALERSNLGVFSFCFIYNFGLGIFMKIGIATPVCRDSSSGNFQTAERWKRIFQNLGYQCRMIKGFNDKGVDVLVVIHAWRSAKLILGYHQKRPKIPILLCLAGTDIYRFQITHPKETDFSMKIADKLICLHDLVYRSIPSRYHNKLYLIRQSALKMKSQSSLGPIFEILLVGHLREEKDPFCGAKAVRSLPIKYKTNIIHIGRAMSNNFQKEALDEMSINHRYQWLGELPRWKILKKMRRARALLISSIMEGGANVVSEAIMTGLPVIASKIDGNIGLLGMGYQGYFPVGDIEKLRKLLIRIENEPCFLKQLEKQILSLQEQYREEVEQKKWETLLKLFSIN